jgi:aspartate aminotransferase
MTGWRIGYTAGPEELISQIATLQSHSTSNPTSIAMKAALAALTQPASALPGMQQAFAERRNFVVGRLNAIPGITCLLPQGAFYVFPNVGNLLGKKPCRGMACHAPTIATCMQLADYLLDKARVAVVPGDGFGADDNIRISYATSMQNLQNGLDRIETALKEI